MNDRRSFIRGLGLVGALAGGFAATRITNPGPVVGASDTTSAPSNHGIKAVDSKLAPPDNAHTLQITGSYGAPESVIEYEPNTIYFAPTNRTVTHSVSMTVGRDNRLWMKIGDEWKRIAIE